MELSEKWTEIIGWNEDDGTAHVRNEVIQLEAENQRLREAVGQGLYAYKMPERLGSDWAYAHKGIIRDGFATRDDAIDDALKEGG